ncbi:MAG: aminotransferase class III-fold pyridoxal phosphate-dependent enzyme, partial [Deltaproteobacteria bacterium]|nr:aminotransferase class III-fold pyridoxal phosphate-dependent enzyme [Deltaproteobacteria bacterium]
DENDPKGSTERALSTLKNLLAEHKDEYAAMSFELVLGEGGFYPGQKDFFISLMKELKKHKVAVLVDEVQSFARTTEPFAFQHFGLDEYVDIVWIGKASQACATLFRNDFKPKPGLLSQTYTASSSAIQASLVILEELMKKDYYGETGKISNIQNSFRTGLEELNEKYPQLIKGPYGVGAMVAFTPFNGELEQTKALVKKLFDNGVMSFFCGKSPVRVRFLIPALAVNENHIKDVLDILEKSLLETQKDLGL